MTYAGAAVGLAFTLLVGLLVKPLLAGMRRSFKMKRFSKNPEIRRRWKQLTKHPDPSGDWVGWVERIYFFFAIGFGSWEALGIWLVFKVASKWEAWNQMGFVPDNPNGYSDETNAIPSAGSPPQPPAVTPLEWARARRIWAAMGYGTFVVGTAVNLFVAVLGVLISLNIVELGNWMGEEIQWRIDEPTKVRLVE
jgi:hypothetical protein